MNGTEKTEKKPFTGELRSDLEIFNGEPDSNGNQNWVIFDPVSDKYFRLNAENHSIVGALSGNMELDVFVDKLHSLGINANREKVTRVLHFLHQSNLMMPIYQVSENKISKFRQTKRNAFFHILLNTYLFFKIPILQPDRMLSRTVGIVSQIFNWWTIMFITIIAVAGYISLIIGWHKLTADFLSTINFQGLMRYSFAVILIKFIHEFAHAYTAKARGVRVRRMGMAFIVFFPRLYTDLTDSWRISSRKNRFLIDSAGIISELLIGGWAALVWANSGPGVTQSIAYYIFAVSIINTVLINGNPFIRYDGYYLLMDLVNIDNLQSRSIERIREKFRQYCFGIDYHGSDNTRGWKKSFLIFFGIASFLYRIFLYTSIILIVYFQFTKTLGILLLILEVWLLIIKPCLMEYKTIIMLKDKIKKRNFILSIAGVSLVLLTLLLPLPWNIALPCEIKPAQTAMIYAKNDGYLEKLYVDDGKNVNRGDLVMVQRNPSVEWTLRESQLELEICNLELDSTQSSTSTLGQTQIKFQAKRNAETSVKEFQHKIAALTFNSPIGGIFALYDRHLKPGKWLHKGEIIGEIFNPEKMIVTAYIPETDLKKIKGNEQVSITLNDLPGSYDGKIICSVTPSPVVLPSSPLLNVYGGIIACYPSEEPNTFQPIEPHYRIDIEINSKLDVPAAGRTGTIWMRKYSSIGGTVMRNALSTLLKELSF